MACRVEHSVFKMGVAINETSLDSAAAGLEFDRDTIFSFCGRRGIQFPKIPTAMVHQLISTESRITDVVFLLETFTLKVFALGGAGIEIADSFMIGDEPDALSHPVRADRVSFKIIKDSLEISFSLFVDPDFPDHSSTIPLPA